MANAITIEVSIPQFDNAKHALGARLTRDFRIA